MKHTDDETWQTVLQQVAELAPVHGSHFHKNNWQEIDFPNNDVAAKGMLRKIMDLDPAKRADIDQILRDPFWQ